MLSLWSTQPYPPQVCNWQRKRIGDYYKYWLYNSQFSRLTHFEVSFVASEATAGATAIAFPVKQDEKIVISDCLRNLTEMSQETSVMYSAHITVNALRILLVTCRHPLAVWRTTTPSVRLSPPAAIRAPSVARSTTPVLPVALPWKLQTANSPVVFWPSRLLPLRPRPASSAASELIALQTGIVCQVVVAQWSTRTSANAWPTPPHSSSRSLAAWMIMTNRAAHLIPVVIPVRPFFSSDLYFPSTNFGWKIRLRVPSSGRFYHPPLRPPGGPLLSQSDWLPCRDFHSSTVNRYSACLPIWWILPRRCRLCSWYYNT